MIKRCSIVLIVALVLLVACGRDPEPVNTSLPTVEESVSTREQIGQFSINDGRYVSKRTAEGNVEVPYILIHESKFNVIQQYAISYQPSGMLQLNNNKVVMKSTYAGKDYCWIFQLVEKDTMKFIADESVVPESDSLWEDGMVFSLDEADDIILEELKTISQEYLSGGDAGHISTITNWDDPIITIIDSTPPYFIKVSDGDLSGLVYQVEYNTTQDGVLGPIILYMDPDGTIIGVSPRE